jgi:hypothetical protein
MVHEESGPLRICKVNIQVILSSSMLIAHKKSDMTQLCPIGCRVSKMKRPLFIMAGV